MGRAQQGRKRRRRAGRENRAALTAFCVALTAIMLALIVYVAQWYLNRARIQAQGERYAQIYNGGESESPAPTAPATPLPVPTATPTVAPTAPATAKATARPTKRPTATPAPTATPDATKPAAAVHPTDAPLPAPSPSPAPAPGSDMPVAVDVPIPTPDGETLVIALPTAPPVQAAFTGLLDVNPETVGFLDIEGMLALPVVQRENDNTYYLNHSFEGAEVQEGALFLDGMNRLVPEDDCLIVYGHNMKNKTMFGRLSAYGDIDHLRRHPVIRFDTLYENRSYVVFAAFTASMKPGDRRYFDVRQFVFDEGGFDRFVLKLKSRSVYNVPVEVRGGDRLLLLVTCDYTNREGRFILALRQLRPEETEGGVWAQVMQASEK